MANPTTIGDRMRAQSLALSATVILASSLAGTAAAGGGATLQPKAGDPLPALTKAQASLFWAGRELYATPFGPENGLGPALNKSNCQSCHSNPVGGWGSISVTRFGGDNKGEFFPLEELGGSLLQALAINDSCREVIPPEATVVAVRMTNSSMAFGMIEAIPDAAIAANEDPFDSDGDGISGRVHWVLPLEDSPTSPLRAGRFGWKAQIATILSFSADATRNEMGVTNALIPTETAPNGDMSMLAACDLVADPEDVPDAEGFTFIERVTHFQRYLAQPPQTPRSGMTGELVFNAIGCNKCHIADWTTGSFPGLEPALAGQAIRPYSDFLLHDMGLLADGVQEGDANEQEFRTPVLWNLRTRDPMLHNGAASGGTFEDRVTIAIEAHGPFGEGAASAAAFAALSATQRGQLLQFLGSLGRNEFDFDANQFIDAYDLSLLAACRKASTVTPDDDCAIGDIDQNGIVDSSDMDAFLLAAARDGVDVTGDCDGDGIVDFVEIFNGAPDLDLNGVPDNCAPACPADFTGDGLVNGGDLAMLLNGWGGATYDLNNDGTTGGADLAILLGAWGACGN
ncbi:MAG: hypothetical protein RL136_2047 [Planctomycetota bacterium]|jgi:hypothetical protein